MDIKCYRLDNITKGKLSKEEFVNEKFSSLNEDAEIIAKEARAAVDGGGIIYVAYMNKQIADMYIFTRSGEKENAVLELTSEYHDDSVLTDEVEKKFNEDIKNEMIKLSSSYNRIIFKDEVINKGDYKTQMSVMGLGLGFFVGFMLFGIVMNNIPMGICLGVPMAICYGLCFAKHVKVERAPEEA